VFAVFLALVLMAALFSLGSPPAHSQPSPCTPGVDCDNGLLAGSATTGVGANVDIDLSINYSSHDMAGWQTFLEYNSAVVSFVPVGAKNAVYNGSDPFTWDATCVDSASTGTLRVLACGSATSNGAEAPWTGWVVTARFQCIAAGATTLRLVPPAGAIDNSTTFDTQHLRIPTELTAGSITCQAESDLELYKTGAPEPVVAGGQITYTIMVHNQGPMPARGMIIGDDLPDDKVFFSSGVDVNSDTVPELPCVPGWLASYPLDDDGDTLIDEDPVDGIDNDSDTLVDEDPPNINVVECIIDGPLTGVPPIMPSQVVTVTIVVDVPPSAAGTREVNTAGVFLTNLGGEPNPTVDPYPDNNSDHWITHVFPSEPHYACYGALGVDPPGGVSLETQFGVELRVEVGRGTRLCAPAIKNGEGTLNHTHLRWFQITEPAPNRVVNIFTQFGEFDNVLLGNAAALLAPTSKEVVVPPGGGSYQRTEEPHYKCYSAGATHAIASATVQDQFYPQGMGWNVGDLVTLCLPAGKNGAPIPEAPDLACFISVRDASLPPHTVNLETQFGPETGIALPPTMISTLCVPAMKEVVGPNYDCRPTASPGVQVDPPPVRLETQFGVEEDADPAPPLMSELLCAPALKNGEGNTQAAHLRSFNLWDEPPLDPPPVVNLTTQFGELNNVVVSVGSYAPWLLAPASKTEPPFEPPTPPAEPHYKCYNISGPSVGQTVLVESQFTPAGGEPMGVGGPAMLCLPAGKNEAPIPDAPHLVCYVTSQPGPAHWYWVLTQFGFEELWVGVGTPTFLCVPAEKELACIDRLGDTQCDDPVNDFDDDGCTDAEEQAGAPAPKPGSTGAYNPAAWYDFYDVPVPAKSDALGANGTKNRAVNLQDVVAVLKYVGTSVNGAPNSNGVDYDTIKGVDLNGDSTNDIPSPHQIKEGEKYDRSPGPLPNPPYDAGPPDGVVNLQDVVVVLKQVGLACTGVP
jgi:uncharacterized repeat protein (TIGR01451 family)